MIKAKFSEMSSRIFLINGLRFNRDYFIGMILSALLLIPISPIWPYLGVPGSIVAIIIYSLYLLTVHGMVSVSIHQALIAFVAFSTISFLSVIYYIDIDRISLLLQFFLGSIFAFSIHRRHIFKFVEFSTKIIALFIFGAFISIMWKSMGFNEIFAFLNPDGRTNFFFPFSLSNSVSLNFLRPAGIYDEPGAFSFFICAVVTMRVLLNLDEKKTFVILLLGLVTMSLAHAAYTLLFIFSLRQIKGPIYIIAIFIISLSFLIIGLGLDDAFHEVFISRFIFNDGSFQGDNRSSGMIYLADFLHLHPEIWPFGLSPDLLKDKDQLLNYIGSDVEVGGNPLNMLLNYGAFGSLAYYLSIIFLIYKSVRIGRVGFSLLGFVLLTFQRDYFFVLSYSFAILFVIRLVMIRSSNIESNLN